MISYVWTGMLLLSVVTACSLGRADSLAASIPIGTEQAVSLCLTLTGLLALWSGVMELMEQSGICHKIAVLLRPALSRLFPSANNSSLQAISANVTANLLGLSNAATPFGLKAADELFAANGECSDLLRFIVLNTTSLQLVPTTVAAVRSSLGAENPFDIMPAIWAASAISVAVGLSVSSLLNRLTGGLR